MEQRRITLAIFIILLPAAAARTEDGYDLWMRYRPIEDKALRNNIQSQITEIVVPGTSKTLDIVRAELRRGIGGLLDRETPAVASPGRDGALVVGTPHGSPLIAGLGLDAKMKEIGPEGYVIRSASAEGRKIVAIVANTDIGALYGSFHFLRLIQTHHSLSNLEIAESPTIQFRLLNHWDDLGDGIERGYAGKSLWKWDELPGTLDPRYCDYARADASLGINGAVLNNVNADPKILRSDYLKKVAALADVFRPYGIRVYLSANFASPLKPAANPTSKKWGGIGDLETADPFDPAVRSWWKNKSDEIYREIPDFGGYLVKADSEGMPGPQSYNRNHAEGANMLAEALKPHGGIVMWRAFVYGNKVDPDRAKRATLQFVPLDGQFADNVFVQPKNGPLDFQPREPIHPLFGAMPKTPLLLELQITQEYLGHSTHLVYLAPMWKEVLDFDTVAEGPGSTVAKIIEGKVNPCRMSGIAGVANTGSDRNWCGHDFAQANWYAFGRLAWNPGLSSEAISDEWARMTWGNDPKVVATCKAMMLGSWRACVNYMTPLGLSFLVETGNHYNPAPEKRVDNYWFADKMNVGYDRTTAGSNAVGQYRDRVRDTWNDRSGCPEEYLLWFHLVSWDLKMNSGRSLWEELCFLYNDGVNYVKGMETSWGKLRDKVDAGRFFAVGAKLKEQEIHAAKWRDVCLGFFAQWCERKIPSGPERGAAGNTATINRGIDVSVSGTGVRPRKE